MNDISPHAHDHTEHARTGHADTGHASALASASGDATHAAPAGDDARAAPTPPHQRAPTTFAELLERCPAPFRTSLAGIFTDPAEREEYEAEVLVHAIDITPVLPHEWTLLREVGEMRVELSGLLRVKAQLFDEARREVLSLLLAGTGIDMGQASALANAFVAGEAKAIRRVQEILDKIHLTTAVIEARAHGRAATGDLQRQIEAVAKRRDRLVRDLHNGSGNPRSRNDAA